MSTHTTTMHSPQNKKVLNYLLDKRPHTTLDIFKATKTINVAAVVSSIRKNGYRIDCKLLKTTKHSKIYTYTLKNKIAKKLYKRVLTDKECINCDFRFNGKDCINNVCIEYDETTDRHKFYIYKAI